MATTSRDLFAFLEANVLQGPGGHLGAEVAGVDPVLRALELASGEWSEEEAATELAGLVGREELVAGQRQLLALLSATPFAARRGIRAARILWSALDLASGSNP